MSREVKFSKDARDSILKGMNILANAVKCTLGPKGRNVIIDKGYEGPMVTNDGVTIAKEIDLEDKYENMGAQLLFEVANKTNDVAGDGTTTATVLAQSMIESGIKAVEEGANPVLIKEGIELCSKAIVERLVYKSKKIETNQEIESIATISSGNKEIGKIIADAIEKIGQGGVINVDESTSFETELEIVEGMKYDKGYVSPYMVTNRDKMEVELEDAYVLITDNKINTVQDILPVLEETVKLNRPLLIIADDFDSDVISTLIVNKLRGTVNVVATRAPGFGVHQKDLLQDIAVLTNTKVWSRELDMKLNDITLKDLGKVSKIVVTKDSTTIITNLETNNYNVEKRISEIKSHIETAKNEYELQRLEERLGKLTKGVALIKVGAATESELKHKKLKIEDAVNATKAAVEEGIVIGGGAVLIEIYNLLKNVLKSEDPDIQKGINIVLEALLTPTYWICENAGFNGNDIVKIQKEAYQNQGFDAKRGKWVNMIEEGIIDPTKVTKSAIINAASIASLFITTEAIVVVIKKDEQQIPNLY